jgi:PPOX class probable F420-dependent enzyme
MRDPRASDVTSGAPGTFEALKHRKYALVVTFKRDGDAVPTPTWFGLGDDGNVYTHTSADSWKVKRISRDSRVPSHLLTRVADRSGPRSKGALASSRRTTGSAQSVRSRPTTG